MILGTSVWRGKTSSTFYLSNFRHNIVCVIFLDFSKNKKRHYKKCRSYYKFDTTIGMCHLMVSTTFYDNFIALASSIVKKFEAISYFGFSRISGQNKVQPDLWTQMARCENMDLHQSHQMNLWEFAEKSTYTVIFSHLGVKKTRPSYHETTNVSCFHVRPIVSCSF